MSGNDGGGSRHRRPFYHPLALLPAGLCLHCPADTRNITIVIVTAMPCAEGGKNSRLIWQSKRRVAPKPITDKLGVILAMISTTSIILIVIRRGQPSVRLLPVVLFFAPSDQERSWYAGGHNFLILMTTSKTMIIFIGSILLQMASAVAMHLLSQPDARHGDHPVQGLQ